MAHGLDGFFLIFFFVFNDTQIGRMGRIFLIFLIFTEGVTPKEKSEKSVASVQSVCYRNIIFSIYELEYPPVLGVPQNALNCTNGNNIHQSLHWLRPSKCVGKSAF